MYEIILSTNDGYIAEIKTWFLGQDLISGIPGGGGLNPLKIPKF
jgi:hypothetical protein